MSRRFLCVHGHFYQPPRENPWLEDIEIQDSAHPYHNWNERITFECYAPNTASRLLDAQGRIVDIVNNYRLISFNFGPTLLSWMERRTPEIHAKIVEADRLSAQDRSGHGNALAQVYNHVIMPLASRRDKVTQVRWGIADFHRRFAREPEGMWLAETAVDTETLEILADEGIRFTVLSPAQAAAVRPLDAQEWTDVGGGKVDPSRAYKWTSPSGKSLALFFYDSPISHAVAFEGLLNSGEVFARRLMDGFADARGHDQLVHIATDGESYGHHHRFGDMALAHALRKIESEGLAVLTNYGEFLEKCPPEMEARIVENSSWSCAHGVERWSSDCGCRIGHNPAWKQAWRAPLRQALNGLRDGLDDLFDKHAKPLLKDPWAARDAYIDVILNRAPQKADVFFQTHEARPLNAAQRVEALRLLECQRQRLLMFTSCAWFFDEISGIETVAVLCFAARALQLVRDHGEALALEQKFLSTLAEAPSNVPSMSNGEEVYRRHVAPVVTDLPRIAAHEAIESLFKERPAESALYCFRVTHVEKVKASSDGNTLSMGRLRVESAITGESLETSYAALHLGGHDIHCVLKLFPDPARHAEVKDSLLGRFADGSLVDVMGFMHRTFDDRVYNLHDLLLEERRRVLGNLIRDVVGRYDPIYRTLVQENGKLIRMIRSVDMPVPEAFRLAMQYVLSRDMELILQSFGTDASAPEKLLRLKEEADGFALPLDWAQAARTLRHRMEDAMETMHEGFSAKEARGLLALLELCEKLDLSANFWRLENMFHSFSSTVFSSLPPEEKTLASSLGVKLRFPPLA